MPEQQYESMDGQSELVTNEVPPDVADPTLSDEATPKTMTTHLAEYTQESRPINIPGESV